MTRFVKLTTSEYRAYGDMSFEEGRIARKLAQVARQQKERDNVRADDDGNWMLGNLHSNSPAGISSVRD